MVNDRTIKGKHLTQHPLADGRPHGVYSRTPPIMCIRADVGGKLDTDEGIKTFHAGDWICTNIPPDYAWIIDAQTFQVSNFTQVGELNTGGEIVFPIAEGDAEVEHTRYTGRVEAGPYPASDPVAEVMSTVGQGSTDAKATAEAAMREAAANDPLAPEHMITPSQTPPTKAGLPQQNPQKAVTRPPARPRK